MFPLSLWGPVGPGLDNDQDDVKSVATNLISLGYGGAQEAADTGEWNDSLESDVREYQRASGLTVDGLAHPGGETERSLNGNFLRASKADNLQTPAPDESNNLTEGFTETDDRAESDSRRQPGRPNPFAIARTRSERERSFFTNTEGTDFKQGDPGTAFLGNNLITGRPIQFGTIAQPSPPSSSVSERPVGAGVLEKLVEIAARHAQMPTPQTQFTIEDQERALTARGFRYRPDPMGRLGLGDWIDAAGRVVGEDEKERTLMEGAHLRRPHAEESEDLAPPRAGHDAPAARGGHAAVVDRLRRDGRSKEQIENFMRSDIGPALASALGRIEAAADAQGHVPAAMLNAELQRLGIASPPEDTVVPASDGKDPKNSSTSRRFNFGADAEPMADGFRRIWAWLSKDIQPLADAKRSSLRSIDETIRALEEERKKPGLTVFERWSIDTNLAQLLVTRSKVNVAFPSSPLDLAAAGISAIGVVQLGSRAVPLFRQGNKVFDADELAKGTWQQAKPIEKLDEYSAAEWRIYLEQKYGKENVTSTTIPGTESRWWPLRNQQHRETKIWYDSRGFPIFDPVAKFDTRLPDGVRWQGTAEQHARAASRQIWEAIQRGQVDITQFSQIQLDQIRRGAARIKGYSWHHHQEFGRMQLVPEEVHDKTKHIGGIGIIEGR